MASSKHAVAGVGVAKVTAAFGRSDCSDVTQYAACCLNNGWDLESRRAGGHHVMWMP